MNDAPPKTSRTASLPFMCLLGFVFLMNITYVWDTDTWWHLKTAQIAAESRRLVARDPFTHTLHGKRWVNDEWLGESMLYGAYEKWGLRGLTIFTACAGALLFYMMWRSAASAGASRHIAAGLLLLAALAARSRLTTRPEIAAMVFLGLTLFVLHNFTSGRKATLWLLPLIQAMWANAHPSAILGLFCMGAALGAACAANGMNRATGFSLRPSLPRRDVARLGIIFLVSILTTMYNPYGSHILKTPFEFTSNKDYLRHITEWAPIRAGELFSAYGLSHYAPFLLLLGGCGAALLLRGKRANLFHLALFAFFAFMALSARRFIGPFAIVCAPIAAEHISALFPRPASIRRFAVHADIAAAIIVCLAAIHFIILNPVFIFGFGVHPRQTPVAAASFLNRTHIDGNMYNNYSFGGYLSWKLYPRNRVFWDGRTTFFGPDFYGEHIQFEQRPSVSKFIEIEKKHRIDYAVLSVEQQAVYRAILLSSPRWKLVFWDGLSMILAKESPGRKSPPAYRFTDPYTAVEAAFQAQQAGGEKLKHVREELERSAAQSDFDMPAIRALSFIYFKSGETSKAMRTINEGLRIAPKTASLLALRGTLELQSGDRKSALNDFRKAAKIDSRYNEVMKRLREDSQ